MTKLKGAVVGVGYLGRFHAQKVKASARAELVGVYDPFLANAEKVANELSVKVFNSLDEVASTVDFVTIAAATQAHYDLVTFFLNHKIPVLVEKPIAATSHQALELCALAKKNNVILTVGHIERFNPAYNYLKENQSRIKFLEINRLAPFRTRGSDVSVLHDLMIHDIDLVQFVFNSAIVSEDIMSVQMIRPTIDEASVRLKLASGVVIDIQNSRLTPQIIRNYRAVLDDRVLFMNTATLEGEILISDNNQPELHRIEKIVETKVDALALEIEDFILAVKKEKPVAITPEEATRALQKIEELILLTESNK